MNSAPPPAAEPQGSSPLTAFDVAGILWRWRWAIIGMTVLGLAVSVGYMAYKGKVYQAEATTMVQRQSLANSLNNILSPGAQASEGPRVATGQAQLALSPVIAERTLKEVKGTGWDVGKLLKAVEIEPDANSDVLHFKVHDKNGPLTVRLVNAYTTQYVDYSTELSKASAVEAAKRVRSEMRKLDADGKRNSDQYRRLGHNFDSLQSLVALTTPAAQVIGTATGYTKIKPKLKIMLALGLVLGFVLGIGLAFLLEALDPRLRTADAIARRAGLPLLATLPTHGIGDEPLTLRGEDEQTVEAYRVLLAGAESAIGERLTGMLVVASDIDPERASAAAVNLAITSARAGHTTTLVDIGFERGGLSQLLGAAGRPGVSDTILGDALISETRLPIKVAGKDDLTSAPLHFIPAGTVQEGRAGLTGSDAVRSALKDIASGGGLVIIDPGGTAASSGAISAAGAGDFTLLVGERARSGPEQLTQARSSLSLGDARPLGVAVFV